MASHTARTIVDTRAVLNSAGVARTVVSYRKAETIYSQGDACRTVMYLEKGQVRLSVLSKRGREAVVAVVGPGQFFGEGALAGQPFRQGSATATGRATVLVIDKPEMLRLLHEQHALSDRFIRHLVTRRIRIEADLVTQFFNSVEKRLAQALLRLAHYGEAVRPIRRIGKVTQRTLAEMIGTTRPRVNYLMRKFRRLGFVESDHGLTINNSLLGIVLQD